ncbi:hypothetical protein N0V82_009755 [Gnomoniopsis sp. IMI 355080]|nr:hypothetical protein N0V82_009755 [Gnomoniopsis sp. IMI 355080]
MSAGTPPNGEFNLVDPVTLESELIGVSAFITAWSLVFTIGRFYTHMRKLSTADYLALAGFILTIVYTALCLDIVSVVVPNASLKILFAQGTILGPVIGITKASILFLYLQLFRINAQFRIAVYAGLVLTFVTYFPSVPLEAYYAAPHVGQTWSDLLVNGAPEKLIYWGMVQGSLAVVVDLYLFVLPLPVIMRLHLSTGKRLGLATVFATALMGVVASVVALRYRVELYKNKADSTWPQTQVFICVIVENNVALIVSSMPGFATFVKVNVSESWLFKSLQSRLSGSRGTGGGGGSGMIIGESGGKDGSSPQQIGKDNFQTTVSMGYHGQYHELDELEFQPMSGAGRTTTSTDGLVRSAPGLDAIGSTQRQREGIMVERTVAVRQEQQPAQTR